MKTIPLAFLASVAIIGSAALAPPAQAGTVSCHRQLIQLPFMPDACTDLAALGIGDSHSFSSGGVSVHTASTPSAPGAPSSPSGPSNPGGGNPGGGTKPGGGGGCDDGKGNGHHSHDGDKGDGGDKDHDDHDHRSNDHGDKGHK